MSAELAAASAPVNGLTSLFTVVAPVLAIGVASIYTIGFVPGSEAFLSDVFRGVVDALPGLEAGKLGNAGGLVHLNPNA